VTILNWWKYAKGLYARVTQKKKTRVWIALTAIVAAAIFTRIPTYWINFIVLNIVIFAPGAITAPAAQYAARRKVTAAEAPRPTT
jgi:hypothetical protein